MRKIVVTLAAAALIVSLATSAMAVVNWQPVGTSAFSQTNFAGMNDWQRIVKNDMVVDAAGNVYATANNAENGTYEYTSPATTGPPSYTPIAPVFTAKSGGLTIFKPNGTKIDVNLSDLSDSTWSTRKWGPDFTIPPYTGRTDSKYAGAITKLVVAGDGKVYGLMNWQEIHWDYQRQNQRIVRFNDDGTITPIWAPPTPSRDIRYTTSYTWQESNDKIRGIAASGNYIYIMMNGADSYWKTNFFWRYDVFAGTLEGPTFPGTNQGMSETHRFFGLEYVGNDQFAVFGARQDGSSAKWDCDPMSWTSARQWIGTNGSDPGWGRDWRTAYAFDPGVVKNPDGSGGRPPALWVGGRGAGSGPWSGITNGGSFSIVDLGGGNKGIRAVSNPTDVTKRTYYIRDASRPTGKRQMTLAAKFTLDAASSDYNGTVMVVIPDASSVGQAGPRVCIARDPATHQWKLVDTADPSAPSALATLGGATVGATNTAYLYVKDKEGPSDTVRVVCWWNGTKAYDSDDPGTTQPALATTGPYVNFGVKCDWPWTAQTGTATVTFDWASYAETMVSPSDGWPGTPLAGFMDGSIYPTTYQSTNIMSRFVGFNDKSSTWFFNGTGNISTSEVFHSNNNDPQASGIANGGLYWVNTLAINPDDGSCWAGWGAQTQYSYPDRGNVMIRSANLWEMFDAGTPEAGADVVALAFEKPTVQEPPADPVVTRAYALVCNRTTGAYSLYKAEATQSSGFDYYQYMPLDLVRFHRRGVLFGLDTPKVVTYTNQDQRFFYIEDVNANGIPKSGIKVIPGNDGIGMPAETGGAVNILGYLDVVDGEAVIRAFGVGVPEPGTMPTPLTMRCNAVGGAANGAQPALGPVNGPSNVGLLVQVAGTVAAVDPTNEFDPQWFTVDDGTGGVTYYLDGNGNLQTVPGVKIRLRTNFAVNVGDFVSVIGVSSVDALISQPNPQERIVKRTQRSVLPRDENDVTVYPIF